ncbi:putative methyltransferase, mitochondrial [Vitis vinifera]|uniref:Putative methyltransferase, mitochondrial n=1 Tax=Vitis vinifera TaxID=29760 RepID=A0A438FJ63_VITVI|nr:putative methyltransferase, mitochondrial [Vitis vinifera]
MLISRPPKNGLWIVEYSKPDRSTAFFTAKQTEKIKALKMRALVATLCRRRVQEPFSRFFYGSLSTDNGDGFQSSRVKIFDRHLKRKQRDRAAWLACPKDSLVDTVAENLLDRLEETLHPSLALSDVQKRTYTWAILPSSRILLEADSRYVDYGFGRISRISLVALCYFTYLVEFVVIFISLVSMDQGTEKGLLMVRNIKVEEAFLLYSSWPSTEREACGTVEDCKKAFPTALCLGGSLEAIRRLLRGRGAIEKLIMMDTSYDMVKLCRDAEQDVPNESIETSFVVGDEEFLPIKESSLDLVISCLGLHWTNDLPGAMIQCRLALKPDCLFLAAILGGETLKELRIACTVAQMEREGGISPRVSPLAQVRDAGNLLTRAGFTLPSVDVDEYTVKYRSGENPHLSILACSSVAVLETHNSMPFESTFDCKVTLSLVGLLGCKKLFIPSLLKYVLLLAFPAAFSTSSPEQEALDLIEHLRSMGETNALLQKSNILKRETALATAAVYDSMFAGEDGTIPATFQVIYMTGWREHSSQQKAKRRGSATVSFQDIQKQFGSDS